MRHTLRLVIIICAPERHVKTFLGEPTQALTSLRLFQNSPPVLQVQVFHLRSRPWGLPEELQAGLDARVIRKASNIDDLSQFLPPMMLHQMVKHHFQRDTMKRIFMLLVAHIHPIFPLVVFAT